MNRGDYTRPVGDRGLDLRFFQVQRVGPNIDEDEPGWLGFLNQAVPADFLVRPPYKKAPPEGGAFMERCSCSYR